MHDRIALFMPTEQDKMPQAEAAAFPEARSAMARTLLYQDSGDTAKGRAANGG